MTALELVRTTAARPRPTRTQTVSVSILLAAGYLTALVVAALFPGLVTSTSPIDNNLTTNLAPPGAEHWFGTDRLGRDIFARIVHGTRHSLTVGLAATALAALVGTLLGLLAVLAGRIADDVVMRVVDVLLAFPTILLALLVVAVLGPGTANVVVAIAVASVPSYARLVRSRALVERDSGYVEAARVLGQGPFRIAVTHILPNSLGPLLVVATIGVGTAIIEGSALSFLGFGAPEPQPEWGAMLAQGQDDLGFAWWVGFFPGATITLTVISITILGRWLQRRFEGKESFR